MRCNNVVLIGRLTRDPEIRYTAGQNQTAIATFSIAIDRATRPGEEKKTDFPRIVVFGRQAEACEKYLRKGLGVCIEGRVQTGSYQNKNGDTVYTTDIVANHVDFLEWADSSGNRNGNGYNQNNGQQNYNNRPQGGNGQGNYNGGQQNYNGQGNYSNRPQGGNGQGNYNGGQRNGNQPPQNGNDIPDTFEAIEDDVPF